jgi:hypothetical protein
MTGFKHTRVIPYKHNFEYKRMSNNLSNQAMKIFLEKLENWAKHHLNDEWTWEFDTWGNFVFKIKEDNDAVLFKLKWCGDEQ